MNPDEYDKYIYDIKDKDIPKIYYDQKKYTNNIINQYDYIQTILKDLSEDEAKKYTLNKLKNIDVSNILPADIRAKIQLVHGDFIIIPVDKL